MSGMKVTHLTPSGFRVISQLILDLGVDERVLGRLIANAGALVHWPGASRDTFVGLGMK